MVHRLQLLKAIVPLPEDPEPSVIDKAKVAANLGPWVAKHREGEPHLKRMASSHPVLISFMLVPFLHDL